MGITTKTAEKRFRGHMKSPYPVGCAIRHFGPENVRVVILHHDLPWAEACELERFYIQKFGSRIETGGYNLTDGGEGQLGWKPSLETRQRLSDARKRRGPISEETRLRIGRASRGRKPGLGKKRSVQAVAAMVAGVREKWKDPVYRAKMRTTLQGNQFLRGYRMSEETKAKMRQARYAYLSRIRQEQSMALPIP